MRCLAAASSALRDVLAGPARPAECLGVTRAALYLRTAGRPGVLAVLSHEAVRLPCALLLPTTSAELPLTALAPPPPAAPAVGFLVGEQAVTWTGPAGPVVVRAVREWAPARPPRGDVTATAVAAVRSALGSEQSRPGERHRPVDGCPVAIARAVVTGHPLAQELALTVGDHAAGVAALLLGCGPGLTPSGDDVLAGFLVGAAAFDVDAAALRRAIDALAPVRTTALSAALLWHAARGECIDELAAVAVVLTSQRWPGPQHAERAVSRLLAVGHSSGAALAHGLLMAADSALRGQAVLVNTGGAA